MNPEIKLTHLHRSVLELLNVTSSFMKEESLEDEENLIKILRKIMISKTLYEKNVIAVSGLQGVGKSTIIKNLYKLEPQALPIVAGRGERLPILVTEYPVSNTEAYAIMMNKDENGNWSNIEKELTWEEFRKYAQGDEENAMMLGIRVPFKHFNNSFTSFLILPGFEGTGDDYWETLIEYSLTCANTVIFALNESKLADEHNYRKLMQIMEDFKGTSPIFALTFADQSSDGNRELKETLMKKFDIKQADRVISIGAYNEEKNAEWSEELVRSVEKYCAVSKSYRVKQLKELNNLLRRELVRTMRNIKEQLSYSKDLIENRRVDEVLLTFDNERNKLKEVYSKNLRKSFNIMEGDANKKIQGIVSKTPLMMQLKHAIFKKSFKDTVKMGKTFESLFYAEGEQEGNQTVFEVQNLEAFKETVSTRLGISYKTQGEEGSKLIHGGIRGLTVSEDIEGESIKKSYLMNDENIHDLKILYTDSQETEKFRSKDLADTTKIIPAIASMNLAMTYGIRGIETGEIELLDHSSQFKDWDVMSKVPVGLAKGFAAVAGVDMIDGVPNIAIGIAKSVGVTLAKSTAIGITGALAGAAATGHIIKQINMNSKSDYNEYRTAFKAIREIQENTYLETFDDYMDNIKERLQRRLKEIYGIKDLDTNLDNLYMSLGKVERDINVMGELINAAIS